MVPELDRGAEVVRAADIVIVVGSSLVVYPAAGLILEAKRTSRKFVVDPKIPQLPPIPNLTFIEEKATVGVAKVVEELWKAH
jgi:NAD-dependent deacetylase